MAGTSGAEFTGWSRDQKLGYLSGALDMMRALLPPGRGAGGCTADDVLRGQNSDRVRSAAVRVSEGVHRVVPRP